MIRLLHWLLKDKIDPLFFRPIDAIASLNVWDNDGNSPFMLAKRYRFDEDVLSALYKQYYEPIKSD